MRKPTEDPAIVQALKARRRLIEQLEAISPNVQLLDDESGLGKRLAAVFTAVAEEADQAARALLDAPNA